MRDTSTQTPPAPVADHTPIPHTDQREPEYESLKGCLTMTALLLATIIATVVGYYLFGPRP